MLKPGSVYGEMGSDRPEYYNNHMKEWRKKYPERWKANQLRYRMKSKYNMTLEQREALFAANGGMCASCGEAPATDIDHNHDTGVTRGALCGLCNRALGQLKDDPRLVRKLLEYIERTEGG